MEGHLGAEGAHSDYLAKLVRVLDGDDAAIIGIDFDLRSPMPSGHVGRDSYFSETTDLVRAVHEVSQNRPVVLPKTVAVDDDGECVAESDVVNGFDLGTMSGVATLSCRARSGRSR